MSLELKIITATIFYFNILKKNKAKGENTQKFI
jgi:hypothetical protein